MTFRTLPIVTTATPQFSLPSSRELDALLIARRAGLTGVPTLCRIADVQSRIDRELTQVEESLKTVKNGALLIGLAQRRSELHAHSAALDVLREYHE